MRIRHSISYLLAFIFLCLPVVSWAASVTLRWQANTEPDLAGYRIYYGTASRAYGPPITVGNVSEYTVQDLKEGTRYYFSLTAVDTGGNESGFSAEVSAQTASSPDAEVPQPQSVSVSAGLSSPQVVGTNIEFTASAQGGSGSYEYRFYESNASTGYKWIMVRDFSANSSYSWDSSGKIGITKIGVWARNEGGQSYVYGYTSFTIQEASKLSGVTIQASIPSPQIVGSAITYTALPKGGTGANEYRFYEYSPYTNNQWVMIRDYSTNPSFTWDSSGKVGTTRIGVWARTIGSQQPVYGSIAYSIQDIPKPTSVAISPNLSSPRNEGTYVTFTASAQGGTGSYEYRFYEYNATTGNQWQMVRDFTSNPSYTWNSAGKIGRTYIGVWARSSGGQGYVYSYTTFIIR